jgi:hypothetical protein
VARSLECQLIKIPAVYVVDVGDAKGLKTDPTIDAFDTIVDSLISI